jgi:hypothetical protein
MKRIFKVVLLLVAVVCLTHVTEPKRAMAAAKPQPAVVILQCGIGGEGGLTTVLVVDGTSASPVIQTGGSCAAAVLLLITDGFTLEGVHTFTGYSIFYTMVRTT